MEDPNAIKHSNLESRKERTLWELKRRPNHLSHGIQGWPKKATKGLLVGLKIKVGVSKST